MKHFTMTILSLFLFGCGQTPTSYETRTRALGSDELVALGLDNDDAILPEARQLASPTEMSLEGSLISNLLSGVVQHVFSAGDTRCLPTIIGNAIPTDVEVFALSQGQTESQTYEKQFKSVLGLNLVHIFYKITYHYQADWKGRGMYLTNVKFIPLRVETDPLWSLTVDAVSDAPVNMGTEKNPIARLPFTLTFTAKGIGTRLTTDEFEVRGDTGEINGQFQDF